MSGPTIVACDTMTAAHPLSISVHTNQLEAVDEVCDATLGCAQSDLLGQLLVLVLTGLLAVFVLAVIQHVRQARRSVDEERSRTATERDAFTRFARSVSRIEPASTARYVRADGTGSTLTASGAPPPDRGLQAVQDAYRDTVMAMAHYEEEYDEPLARHMSEEFGEEVATAVTGGEQLTPALKEVLIRRSRSAAADRDRLMARLDDERDALDEASEEFERLAATVDEADERRLRERTYEQLIDEWHRLGETESRLRRLLERRQEQLDPDVDANPDRPSLQGYLYAGLSTTYPVLADGSAMGARIKEARSRVLHALTRRA